MDLARIRTAIRDEVASILPIDELEQTHRADALAWIERLKPRRAILTNLHADLDYEVLRGKLPVHVVPAFDGMTFAVSDGP